MIQFFKLFYYLRKCKPFYVCKDNHSISITLERKSNLTRFNHIFILTKETNSTLIYVLSMMDLSWNERHKTPGQTTQKTIFPEKQ